MGWSPAYSPDPGSYIERNIGAAYDLRSRYLHDSIPPFGGWVRTHYGPGREDVGHGRAVHDDKAFAKLIGRAPKLDGLERLIRYCVLKYMVAADLFDQEKIPP